MEDAYGSHFTDHDLRRGMCIHCHGNADHPELANTQQQTGTLRWFHRMRAYVVEGHVDTCAYCLGTYIYIATQQYKPLGPPFAGFRQYLGWGLPGR